MVGSDLEAAESRIAGDKMKMQTDHFPLAPGARSLAMTGHGFCAVARTVLDEVLGYRVEWIEHQLAHAVRDPNGRAYNRTAFLAGRRAMMQGWADYLDRLKEGKRPCAARDSALPECIASGTTKRDANFAAGTDPHVVRPENSLAS
jgi:hypothetical protein